MFKNTRKIKKWESWGIIWTIILGFLLYFAFELSGNCWIVGIISPINKSLWEYLKISYWSVVLFSLIEYHCIKKETNGFFIGKFAEILILDLIFALGHYIFITVFGSSQLWADIIFYGTGVFLGGIISLSIMKKDVSGKLNFVGLLAMIIIGILFIYFTFYPLHIPLFMDSVTF